MVTNLKVFYAAHFISGYLKRSEKCVILRSMRDLLTLLKAGDAGSGAGMTIPMMNILNKRPFLTASIRRSFSHIPLFLSKLTSG